MMILGKLRFLRCIIEEEDDDDDDDEEEEEEEERGFGEQCLGKNIYHQRIHHPGACASAPLLL